MFHSFLIPLPLYLFIPFFLSPLFLVSLRCWFALLFFSEYFALSVFVAFHFCVLIYLFKYLLYLFSLLYFFLFLHSLFRCSFIGLFLFLLYSLSFFYPFSFISSPPYSFITLFPYSFLPYFFVAILLFISVLILVFRTFRTFCISLRRLSPPCNNLFIYVPLFILVSLVILKCFCFFILYLRYFALRPLFTCHHVSPPYHTIFLSRPTETVN